MNPETTTPIFESTHTPIKSFPLCPLNTDIEGKNVCLYTPYKTCQYWICGYYEEIKERVRAGRGEHY